MITKLNGEKITEEDKHAIFMATDQDITAETFADDITRNFRYNNGILIKTDSCFFGVRKTTVVEQHGRIVAVTVRMHVNDNYVDTEEKKKILDGILAICEKNEKALQDILLVP